MATQFNGVNSTSLLTAAMRAEETKLSHSLFKDPYADILSGDIGKDILAKAIAASGPQPAIAIRTLYIDQYIQKAVQDGFQQIVMLASGMDTRVYRLNINSTISFFEIDQAHVLKYKRDLLKNETPTCHLVDIPMDLTEDFIEELIIHGFDKSKKTLWVIEGLLMYLELEMVKHLFDRLNQLTKSQDRIVCDILGQTLLDSPFMKNQLDFLKSIGAPWKFGTDEPEEFLLQFGWNVITKGPTDIAPDRWPFPVAPRHIKGVPRGFYVEGYFI